MEIQDILRNLQVEQLTPMQEATREAYHENKDLVLLSPTGSGKTLAFLLPLVQSLKTNVQGVQAVVLVPVSYTHLRAHETGRIWYLRGNWHCKLKLYLNPWELPLRL